MILLIWLELARKKLAKGQCVVKKARDIEPVLEILVNFLLRVNFLIRRKTSGNTYLADISKLLL